MMKSARLFWRSADYEIGTPVLEAGRVGGSCLFEGLELGIHRAWITARARW